MNILSIFFEILIISLPLLTISTGALISEYCGVLAVFSDGIVNLSAFIFFTLFSSTGNLILSCILTIVFSLIFIALFASITFKFPYSFFNNNLFSKSTKYSSNPFIMGLAINLFSAGLITILSKIFFHTQGVLSSEVFTTQLQTTFRLISLLVVVVLLILVFILLKYSKFGICLRITGNSENLLSSLGKDVNSYKFVSWLSAAFFSSIAGIILVLKVSSFVPNISSNRGWLALAAVLAGQKKIPGIAIAILVFSAFEYSATFLQDKIPNISPSIIICLPYLVALLAFFIVPNNSSVHE